MRVSPSRTFLVPRSEQSDGGDSNSGGFNRGNNSSFFTFLVALLILAFASAALVLRSFIVRRRFRNRLQAAINAGLIPREPTLAEKPELHEVYVRNLDSVRNWERIMPLSVSEEVDAARETMEGPKAPPPPPPPPPRHGRLLNLLRRHQTATPADAMPNDDDMTESRTRVAVLIAMPSEFPMIPALDDIETIKGKKRDSTLADDNVPDVLIGISSLPLRR